ncbi:hypothetical protein B0T20DRAFT_347247 [Sordaria brevicollis]|uniref:Tyrosinase copper-binding domain-containing protein n=1 Tax=Sordaria brevicollis TaxID=83679 RepID=A0AAE0PIY1_SORBR|nr:hypothetical protein B0T20DRAFT_347247 [Sordaria brevicollis]
MFELLQSRYREWREPRYTQVVDDTESQTSSSHSSEEEPKPVEPTTNAHSRRPCKHIATRREWRSLTETERNQFVDAIHCLARLPSEWDENKNRTVYDDFAILHGGIGSWCHRSASFLPWHRWTLHVFENILKDKCGFPRDGTIPYWDWSLDHFNLSSSSIFSPTTGFGSDGTPSPLSPSSLPSVGEGNCVQDGPFTDLRPIIYNHTYITHCLSRGFNDPKRNTTGTIPGEQYRPEAIGEILRQTGYEEFGKRVEERLHNGLHQSVGGDFRAMTAANDPLFYVHHASLDRMWWRWQWENPDVRLQEYSGKHMFNSTPGEANLEDWLLYGGFTEDVQVKRAMSTESGEAILDIIEQIRACSGGWRRECPRCVEVGAGAKWRSADGIRDTPCQVASMTAPAKLAARMPDEFTRTMHRFVVEWCNRLGS